MNNNYAYCHFQKKIALIEFIIDYGMYLFKFIRQFVATKDKTKIYILYNNFNINYKNEIIYIIII
jgi:hypothetical protein